MSSWGIGLDFQSILPILNQQSKLTAFKIRIVPSLPFEYHSFSPYLPFKYSQPTTKIFTLPLIGMGGLNKKGNRRLSSKIFTPPFRYPPKSDRGAFLAFSEEGLAFDKRVKESERLVVVAYLKSSSTTLSGKQD